MTRTIEGEVDWGNVKVGISVSKWNSGITDEMLEGAIAALKNRGIAEEHILVVRCPGSYELPLSCKYLFDYGQVSGVIAIGAVIRGETSHYDYVCEAVNRGVLDLNLTYGKPVAFGVLTTENREQARERASLEKGNKGAEAALALCEMLALENGLRNISLD